MSETVHDLRAEMLERVSWRETTDLGRLGYGIASTAIDEVFAVLREHGIKLCRDQVGGYDPSDHEINRRWMGKGMGHMVPAFVPLTDEEIGQ